MKYDREERVIRSADNPEVKALGRLGQRKYRERENRYVIEGPNLVNEALENKARILKILVREGAETGEELQELLRKGRPRGIPLTALSAELFDKICDTEHPQGILAVVEKGRWSREDFFRRAPGRESGNILVLDRLQDPGNLGTVLRTADAAGFAGAILIKGCGDIYAPKVTRAAAGSLFRLPVLPVDSPEEAAAAVKNYGKRLICTTLDCKKCYFESMMDRDIALVIGNEGNGVCQTFMEQADELVTIPMEGPVESLNAGVAAGILMYESLRQRRRTE